MITLARIMLAVVCGGVCMPACASEPTAAQLAAGFVDPPPQARPLVFWQWVNGNVSRDGIRLDLEWMRRIGLAGALIFDIAFRNSPVPQFVERRVGYGTAEWDQSIRFAANEAARLGLELGAQSSGGWSTSGGPQVAPGQAMKKLVWSETIVTPEAAAVRLPPPPSNNGPYQDVPIDQRFREPMRYGDIVVIGYRLPDSEQHATARVTLSGAADVGLLDDGRYSQPIEILPDDDGNASILAHVEGRGDFPCALTLAVNGALPAGAVDASPDGVRFTTVIELPGIVAMQPAPARTFALPRRAERYWRIRFRGLKQPLHLTEARFEFGARVNLAQDKAGFGVLADNALAATAPVSVRATVRADEVIDLSAHLAPDGSLSWRPGEGRWMAVRFGWSLTGRRITPATPESSGLEVDKLDPLAVRSFANDFYDRYSRAIGDAGRLSIALTDSWEAGQQNWTPAMLSEFAVRRGYDMRPWMPVLTGRVVGDAERSERFLMDFRRTIADMLADNHYAVLADVAHQRGMRMYAEAAGTDLPTVIDGLQAKGRVDVPMGEFWFYPEGNEPNPHHLADVREAASAAHTYGRPIVAAEALTTRGEDPWAMGPAQLRRIVDRFFAEGINRLVLHTSVHQPFVDRRPGITLREFGQHFTRNETWAEDATDWVRYLARSSYMLQQGVPVADLAIYLGEDAALSPPTNHSDEPKRLPGFDHDFLNSEVLLDRMTVQDGRLTLPGGIRYRVLLISPRVQRMSLPVAEKLRSLIRDGAVVIGPKPQGPAGLAHDGERVRNIANELWGRSADSRMRKVGRGRVYPVSDVGKVLRLEGVEPDVAASSLAELSWVHRATADAEVYFVSNQSSRAFDEVVRFRAGGRHAELWDAVDGSRLPVTHTISDQTTTVRIELAPYTSRFVVFHGHSSAGRFAVAKEQRAVLAALEGPWHVEFLDGQDTPAEVELPAGVSWTENADPSIRYYSGRARYLRTIDIPNSWRNSDRRIELDLGSVADLARVRVNGEDLGVLWNAPYRRDITSALRPGANHFEITVTNYWRNRLIGDEQPDATHLTFTSLRPYSAGSPLRRSGLLGPVRLLGVTVAHQLASVVAPAGDARSPTRRPCDQDVEASARERNDCRGAPGSGSSAHWGDASALGSHIPFNDQAAR